MSEWFQEWFETPYYDVLYEHRGSTEAKFFIENLVGALGLPPGCEVLDVACGKGRHAQVLEQMGFKVTGIDLSTTRIRQAQLFESPNLRFFQHDMRRLFCINFFDAVFSFFTSFGYFESEFDEAKAVQSLSANVKWGGLLVIDYFNPAKVVPMLPCHEVIEKFQLGFEIHRSLKGNKIIKDIVIHDAGKEYKFKEMVRAYDLDDFIAMFSKFHLKVMKVFGNYQLQPFSSASSDRMIIVFSKQDNLYD